MGEGVVWAGVGETVYRVDDVCLAHLVRDTHLSYNTTEICLQ